MPASAPLLRAHGVDKRFGARVVLAGVDIAVGAAEIVTLIGPNGAGKTTLLRILLGLVAPDRGTVERKPGLRIGYMPQRMVIDDLLPLTVRRFLELGRPAGRSSIEGVLDEVKAAHVIGSPVQAISGGELRRVLLARALLRDPELLVLDEPVQGVDVVGQGDLFRLIMEIRDRRRCGVLMVSHDLHLVMAATDTVLCLNGHVCCTGRPEAVTRHPEYIALFGAREADALALYTHHHDHVHDAGGAVHAHHDHDHAQHHHAPAEAGKRGRIDHG
jgi:zinc transport system ATP-binding protein